MDNYQKNQRYIILNKKLNNAIRNEFYYEAIFIEYAIIEDRTDSIIRHAKVFINEPTLSKKLNSIQYKKTFNDEYIKKHITVNLLQDIKNWKFKRNKLIHNLVYSTYSNEEIKQIALEGLKLTKIICGKSTLVNKHLDNKYLITK